MATLEAALTSARNRGKTAEAREIEKKLKAARARAGTEAAVYLTTTITPTPY